MVCELGMSPLGPVHFRRPSSAWDTDSRASGFSEETARRVDDEIRAHVMRGYETSRLDTRVRFINLPEECTISIFSVNGTLVRRYKKDNSLTYLDWDLQNAYNVPIAGGTYICHVDAPGIGEEASGNEFAVGQGRECVHT